MITITEALAEVNLLKKKIEDKELECKSLLTRKEHQKDPYEKDGGMKVVLSRELQSLKDMRIRLMKIRSAISKANIENEIEIGGIKRPIFDWLTWRREIYQQEMDFKRGVANKLNQEIQADAARPQVFNDDQGNPVLVKTVLNMNVGDAIKDANETRDLFQVLDGKLSLKNATITVEI